MNTFRKLKEKINTTEDLKEKFEGMIMVSSIKYNGKFDFTLEIVAENESFKKLNEELRLNLIKFTNNESNYINKLNEFTKENNEIKQKLIIESENYNKNLVSKEKEIKQLFEQEKLQIIREVINKFKKNEKARNLTELMNKEINILKSKIDFMVYLINYIGIRKHCFEKERNRK